MVKRSVVDWLEAYIFGLGQ